MARITVGLALSGGTAKSVAHIGVIKALTEAGIPIDCISGTSGGAVVGAMFASGMPISSIESVATSMSWRKLVSLKFTRLGFISSEKIEQFMTEVVGDVTFEDLEIPVTVVAANLVTGEKREFRSGSLARSVRASCSIPQIYLPVEIDGEYYVDGAVAEYLPVETLAGMGCDFCIGSHLGPTNPSYRRPRHALQLVMQILTLMARKNYVRSLELADFVVHPDLDRFNSFDFNRSEEMIDAGYDAARELAGDLREAIERKSRFWVRLAKKIRG